MRTCAGEARTEAYVSANGGDDASFDDFVQPANLILSTFIADNILDRWGLFEIQSVSRPFADNSFYF